MSPPTTVLALVGFMGCGKTTLGGALAGALGVPFCDLDARIEEESGLSVPEWFARRGEPAFREAERAALEQACRELAEAGGGVLALGGGAFAEEATRRALAGRARTVWLDVPLAVIAGRIRKDGSRPLFKDDVAVARLFAERREVYARADVRVDADGPVDAVVERIRAAIVRS